MRRFILTTLVLGSVHLAGLAFLTGRERSAQAQPQAIQAVQAPAPERAQPAVAAQPPPGASSFQIGEPLFVEWHGSFWPASVLSVVDAERATIHYDGYGPEWDEVITSKRALRDGGAARLKVLQ
jgi:hypothetical protein